MPRNLDKRLELMVPVEDQSSRDRLIHILEMHMADNMSSWQLQPDGNYERTPHKGLKKIRSQESFYHQACEAIASVRKTRRTRFEPHRAANQ